MLMSLVVGWNITQFSVNLSLECNTVNSKCVCGFYCTLYYFINIASFILSRWDRTLKTKVLAEETLHDLMSGFCSGKTLNYCIIYIYTY